ncbi:MAG: hypothetical protein Q8L34_02110 [Candidatus Woesearchaeota archaeon]|nr:hypothetical protein [Candidatus Woesearchaeota archaeon]
MKNVRPNNLLIPILFTVLLSLLILPLISYAVQGKTPVYSQQRAPKIIHIPQYICNQTYSDITPALEQKLQLAQNLSNATLSASPLKFTPRYYLFSMSNPGRTLHNFYLYDVGFDELWMTLDDRAHFITTAPLGNAFLAGTISETSNATEFYWSYVDTLFNPAGNYIYSCTLSSQGCTNQRTIAVTSASEEIMGLSVSTSQNRLYLALEDASHINRPGTLYSCSLSALANDACSLGLSHFVFHDNYTAFANAFPDSGFIYSPNSPLPPVFFDMQSQAISMLPMGVLMTPYNAAQISSSLFFTYRFYAATNPRIDFVSVNTFGAATLLGNDITGIHPALAAITNNAIYFVYTKANPYRQIIKPLGGSETEIYVNTTSVFAPLPFTLQKDGAVLGAYPFSSAPDYHIYMSNCRF